MAEDSPLMIDYSLQDLGYFRFYFAPKLPDEDN